MRRKINDDLSFFANTPFNSDLFINLEIKFMRTTSNI